MSNINTKGNAPTKGSATESNRRELRPPRVRLALVRNGLTLLVGLVLIGWLLVLVDLKSMLAALVAVHLEWLALGVAGNLLSPIWRALRFGGMYAVRGRKMEMIGLMGQFGMLNLVMPAKTGDVAFLALAKHRRLINSIAEALPRWVLLRACDLVAIVGLVVVSTMLFDAGSPFDPWIRSVRWSLLVIVVAVAVTILLARRPSRSEIQHVSQGFFRGRLAALRRGLKGLDNWSILSAAFGWSLLIWSWQAAMVAIQYWAFGAGLAGQQLWLMAVAVLAVSVLPIHAPMAIGTLHAVQVGLLVALGMPASQALGVAIGIHAAMMLTVFLQGAIGTLMLIGLPSNADMVAEPGSLEWKNR